MAKYPEYPRVTGLSPDDLILAVDVDDQTDSPEGSTVGVRIGDVVGNPAPTKVLIGEIDVSTTGGVAEFTIPSGFDTLHFEGYGVTSNRADQGDSINLFLNGDEDVNNYYNSGLVGYNLTPYNWAGAGPSTGEVPGTANTADANGLFNAKLIGASETSEKKWYSESFFATSNATDGVVRETGTRHLIETGPVTSVKFSGALGVLLTGKIRVFGEQAVTIEDSETLTVKQNVPVVYDGDAYTIDLTNYQDGDKLIISGRVRGKAAATETTASLWMNDDKTSGNYISNRWYGINASTVNTESFSPEIAVISGGTAWSSYYAQVEIELIGYATQDRAHTARSRYQTPTKQTENWTGTSGVTHIQGSVFADPITKLELTGGGGLEGEIQCYIEKQGVMPTVATQGGGETTEIDMPVVQSAFIDSDGSMLWSSEDGWSCVKGSNGVFDITFPTDVGVNTNQSVTVTNSTGADQVDDTTSDVNLMTPTGARIRTYVNNAPTDQAFTIIRRIPDTKVVVDVPAPLATHADMPVVQSASMGKTGGVRWSSEDGWACISEGDNSGKYNITFPTAAESIEKQSVVAAWSLPGDTSNTYMASVLELTTTGCTVMISDDADTESDQEFSIIRRLPDVSMPVAETTSKFLIQEIELTGAGGEFFFDNLPQGYDRFIVQGTIRGTGVGVDAYGFLEFNGDTTAANYARQHVAGLNNSAFMGEAQDNLTLFLTGNGATAGVYSSVNIVIEDPSSSNKIGALCSFTRHTDYTNQMVGSTYTQGSAAGPLTSFNILDSGADAFVGKLRLYGEKPPLAQPPAGRYMIQEITDPVSGEFDFTNIPQTYKRLVLKGTVRSDRAGNTSDETILYVNEDTTDTNYRRQINGAFDGAAIVPEGNDAWFWSIPAASSRVGDYASVSASIENPSGSQNKMVASQWNTQRTAGQVYAAEQATQTSVSSAVTSLRIVSQSGSNLTGTLTLYGEN